MKTPFSPLTLACLLMLSLFASLPAWSALPAVNLASGPLFGSAANVHANMLLSLSVEFPTVGIAYRGDGGLYKRTTEYIGYFNPLKCYVYNGGDRNVTDGYFSISKSADAATHECGGGSFSGNFMNWAASSSIDMLRYALTGGDRIVDTPTTTILQRAVLRESFYASGTYFPRRMVEAGDNGSAPNQVTPFPVKQLHIVSCRNRILFSDAAYGGNCDTIALDKTGKALNTDKKLGEYLVRVQVCDSNDAKDRTDLCQKIGNDFKPVGEMQKKADQLRIGVTGYLLDDSPTRYGGVLRSPMKYIGSKKFDAPGFAETANDRPEWEAATGVFYSNPDDSANRNSTTINSGAINYLNKFGRSGVYKALDPVSELYYEGLRYLQGKKPTPEATSGMTDAMKDGFPAFQSWDDPVTASCQRNFILAIADVNTHWDRYIPGNDRTSYNNGTNANDPARPEDAATGTTPALNVKTWTKLVGEMEADASGTYSNPAPRSNLNNLQNLDTGSGGHGTHYMAGLAYWANTHDIRLDKPVRVKTFTIDVDEGGDGLIDSTTRSVKPRDSQLYLAAKYGGFDDKNGDGNPFITLAADGKTILKKSNAEWDNGSGVPANYFLAGQPKQLIESIRKIFSKAISFSGTTSGVSASGSKISTDGGFVYKPGFDPLSWSGRLEKLKLTLDGATSTVQLGKDPEWDAGDVLTGKDGLLPNPAPSLRNIYTTTVAADNSRKMVPFKWAQLNTAQQALLNISPVEGKVDGMGDRRVNFLRGDRSSELGQTGGVFRKRERVLGDIINSNPTYIGAPALGVQGPGYQKFYEDNKGRTAAVYVGANDGMLHAFSASDGKELFAYVPNAVIGGMAQLTNPDYVHRMYVDGALNVSEARIGSAWKTILVSGMGAGAQGIFALDVTDPANFGSGLGALIEFTDSDDPDIGNLAGAPAIGKFKIGTADGVDQYKYFVMASSGFNNYTDDGAGKFDAEARGALFLLSLEKPAGAAWKEGENYFKFKLPKPDESLPNGLSAPAFVAGNNGAVRFVYAGDLQGNLWRFDFSGSSAWSSGSGVAPSEPLFTATDTAGNRQPITVQPKVVFAPGGGYVVLFGTGKYAEAADAAPASFKTQSMYGIRDGTKSTKRSELASRTFTKASAGNGDTYTVGGENFSYDDKRGWFIDFLNSDKTGERSVTNPLVAYGNLFINSLLPGSDPCAAGGGRSYVLNALTGLTEEDGAVTGNMSEVGLLSTPVLFQVGEDQVGDRNPIGMRLIKKKYTIFNFGTAGAKGGKVSESDVRGGRFSWREILNWQELRRATADLMKGGAQ